MRKPVSEEKIKYLKSGFTRILILLVLFTFGFSMKTAVLAKYSKSMNNLTSVVAGDFIFKSNYLFEDGGSMLVINSYDGAEYEIAVDLMNYENSLRYNEYGIDFYYYVDAGVYSDPQCTKNITGDYTIKVTYGNKDEGVAAVRKEGTTVKERYGALRGLDVGAEINKDGEMVAQTYEQLINSGAGKETVKVLVTAKQPMTTGGTIYVRVNAYTMPLPQMKTELSQNSLEKTEKYVDITAPERGVYYEKLYATFELNHTVGDAEIFSEFYPGSTDEYDITYRLRCSETSNGTCTVRVYYDPDLVFPDESLGTPILDKTKDKRYIQTNCQSGGTVTMLFRKLSLSYSITKNDFSFEKVTDSSDIDESLYTATTASSAEGIVTITPAQTKMMNEVEVNVEPPGMMMINGILITTDSGYTVPVLSTKIDKDTGKGTFKFTMPNEDVTVLPSFCHIIQLTCGANGTAVVQPTGARAGTLVALTASPKSGYKVDKVLLNGKTEGITDEGNNAFSFYMPDGETTVSVSFVSEQNVEDDDDGEDDDDDDDDDDGGGGNESGSNE